MEKNEATDSKLHPFERAGLGKAPFRAIGMAERTFQVAPGEPVRPGGCCKYCYTGIRYAILVQSSDGKVFDVGSDCVEKIDIVAYREAMAWKREQAKIEWETRGKAAAEERARLEAAWKIEADEREAAWRLAHPDLAGMLDVLDREGGFGGKVANDVRASVRFGEAPQMEDLAKVRQLHGELTATGYVGTSGKRETFKATYLGRHTIDSQFGQITFHKFACAREDGTHALLVWKTNSVLRLDNDTSYTPPARGSLLTFQATVKEHSEFRGIRQTMITRVSKVKRASE